MPTSSPPALVWIPLAIVGAVVIGGLAWGVETSAWALAGLALVGGAARAAGVGAAVVGAHRRTADAATLAILGLALAYLAASGVLE